MRDQRVFYGWWVALSFAVMVFLSTGIRFAVGPFLKPMVADLGLDRASFSLVIAVSLFLYGGFQPLVGGLVDRFGARAVTAAGSVLLAATIAATGAVTQLWHLYLVYGVLAGLGLAATGQVVGSAVLARWFTRRRATALSVLSSAGMAGISLLLPVFTWMILTLGWRTTYVVMGMIVLVVFLPLSLWIVRDAPEQMGLHPDGLAPGPAAASMAAERTELATAVQTLPFWQLAVSLFTCGFSMSLISAHGVPMLTDHGYHPMTASWVIGILGGSSMVFAMLLGAAGDRFGRRPVLAWLYGARAFIFIGLFLIVDNPLLLFAVAIVGGLTMTGTMSVSSALIADFFGRRSVGSVFGVIFVIHQTGSALGSWLGGVLFETTGGYGAAFAASALLLIAASIVSLTIDERWQTRPALSPATGG